MEEFKVLVNEIGVPNLEKREMFRGIFDGRYKLVRYFGMGNYNLPTSVQQLLADNDVALYDLQSDPIEETNLLDRPLDAEAAAALERLRERLTVSMNQPRAYRRRLTVGGRAQRKTDESTIEALRALGYVE